jgi:putative ABC transport system permease protein
MNLLENIKEGLRSVQANLLRSVLTALIVAIGITSLVGILTAIDAIEQSVNESLATLGVNTFDIRSKTNRGSNRQGVTERSFSQLKMSEAFRFIDQYRVASAISLSADITQIAEVKHLSKKTNPNVFVTGVNEEYMAIKGLEVDNGRNFSRLEIQYGSAVAILGYKVYTTLYKNKEDPTGTEITFSGTQFRVIGVLKEKGQLADHNYDNMVLVPIIKGNQMAKGRGLWYEVTVGISDPTQLEVAMGEATGVMRSIRRDRPGEPNSF